LLGHAEPTVRATAALTLGDFTSLNSSTIARLQELVNKDASPNVREAAESALSRQQLDSLQIIPTLSITPL
jgi:HEAT repeat protein